MLCIAGAVKNWLDKCDDKIQAVSATVNGPLIEALAEATGFSDKACIEQFRKGAPILGRLPSSGRGTKRSSETQLGDVHELAASRVEANKQLLTRRREDENSGVLLEKTQQDAELGRMSPPVSLRHVPKECLLASRFSVEQGFTDTGDKKIRPIDDLSASGVNGCCAQEEKLSNDGVDTLFQVARQFTELVGEVPWLFKADIDAAYRRIPLKVSDR